MPKFYKQNASAFEAKRLNVLLQTPKRFLNSPRRNKISRPRILFFFHPYLKERTEMKKIIRMKNILQKNQKDLTD
jgi:predicted metal-dependent hydrolase